MDGGRDADQRWSRPGAVYQEVSQHFSEKELADLTLAVAAINAWNRLSIAGRLTPGTYQPAQVTA